MLQPTELNAILTLVTNYFYTHLTEKEFTNLAIFLSLLSKEMIAMEAIRSILRIEERDPNFK